MNDILIVEDDSAMNDGIAMALREEQTNLIQCHSMKQAREILASHTPQLVLFDVVS